MLRSRVYPHECGGEGWHACEKDQSSRRLRSDAAPQHRRGDLPRQAHTAEADLDIRPVRTVEQRSECQPVERRAATAADEQEEEKQAIDQERQDYARRNSTTLLTHKSTGSGRITARDTTRSPLSRRRWSSSGRRGSEHEWMDVATVCST